MLFRSFVLRLAILTHVYRTLNLFTCRFHGRIPTLGVLSQCDEPIEVSIFYVSFRLFRWAVALTQTGSLKSTFIFVDVATSISLFLFTHDWFPTNEKITNLWPFGSDVSTKMILKLPRYNVGKGPSVVIGYPKSHPAQIKPIQVRERCITGKSNFIVRKLWENRSFTWPRYWSTGSLLIMQN